MKVMSSIRGNVVRSTKKVVRNVVDSTDYVVKTVYNKDTLLNIGMVLFAVGYTYLLYNCVDTSLKHNRLLTKQLKAFK